MPEIIPLLSILILVSSIGTFVMAIGAYIHFRLKSRKVEEKKQIAEALYKKQLRLYNLLHNRQK